MRTLCKSSLALSLGLLATAARGQEAAHLEPPIARAGPAAVLGRPIAVAPADDAPVRPASFVGSGGNSGLVARPLPTGVPTSAAPPPRDPAEKLHGWRRPDDPAPIAPPIVPIPQGAVLDPGPGASLFAAEPCPGAPPAAWPCAGGADPGCGGNRFYGSAEYLLWWTRGDSVPPLVSTGSPTAARPGALGSDPAARVLFGDSELGTGARSGARFLVGWWFDDRHSLGVEVGGFFLGEETDRFSATSLGDPVLARPFFNAFPNPAFFGPSAEGVARPGVLAGTVDAKHRSSLWGAEVNLRTNACCGCGWNLDLLLGYRQLGLDESLRVNESLVVLTNVPVPGGVIPAGTTFQVNDAFSAHNRFYGAQVGAEAQYRTGRWSFGLRSKVALGPTQQLVDVSGNTVVGAGGQQFAGTGGLLALSSNIGRHTRDVFTVVPEVGVTVGYNFTDRLRGFAGYNFLYWSSVVRAGQQIDPVVNSSLQPFGPPQAGPARPAFAFNGTDFWAQGLTLGLEFRY